MKTKLQLLIGVLEIEIDKLTGSPDEHTRGHRHGLNRALYLARQLNVRITHGK